MPATFVVRQNGSELGPMTAEELIAKAAAGDVRPDAMVRKEPAGNWVTAGSIKSLVFPLEAFSDMPDEVPEAAEFVGSPPEASGQTRLPRHANRYGQLRLLSTVISIFAWIELAIGLVLAFGMLVAFAIAIDRSNGAAIPMLVTFAWAVGSTVGIFVLLKASAEFILLAIDVSDQTRDTRDLIARLK